MAVSVTVRYLTSHTLWSVGKIEGLFVVLITSIRSLSANSLTANPATALSLSCRTWRPIKEGKVSFSFNPASYPSFLAWATSFAITLLRLCSVFLRVSLCRTRSLRIAFSRVPVGNVSNDIGSTHPPPVDGFSVIVPPTRRSKCKEQTVTKETQPYPLSVGS